MIWEMEGQFGTPILRVGSPTHGMNPTAVPAGCKASCDESSPAAVFFGSSETTQMFRCSCHPKAPMLRSIFCEIWRDSNGQKQVLSNVGVVALTWFLTMGRPKKWTNYDAKTDKTTNRTTLTRLYNVITFQIVMLYLGMLVLPGGWSKSEFNMFSSQGMDESNARYVLRQK